LFVHHSIPIRRECDQVAVQILDDEGACAPRLGAQGLVNVDASGPVFKKERLGVIQCDRCREQVVLCRKGRIGGKLVDMA
jgi:hypothetical protein